MSAASGCSPLTARGRPRDETLRDSKKTKTGFQRGRRQGRSCTYALSGPARLPKRPAEGIVKWQHIQESSSAAALSR